MRTLGAERVLAAERDDQFIVVEVKSFLEASPMTALERAVGQYVIYRDLLQLTDPKRRLYLAVGVSIYTSFMQGQAVRVILKNNRLSVIVVDIERESIISWIK